MDKRVWAFVLAMLLALSGLNLAYAQPALADAGGVTPESEPSAETAAADSGMDDVAASDMAEPQADDAELGTEASAKTGAVISTVPLSELSRDSIQDVESARFAALHAEVENADISIDAELGYGNTITYSKTIPIAVHISNSGADITGTLAMNLYASRSEYDRVELPVYIAAGSERSFTLPVSLSQKQSTFTIELVVDGAILASANFAPVRQLDPNIILVGVLGSDANALSYMCISATNDPLLRGEYFQTLPLSLESFPDTAALMQAFTLIVVSDMDMRKLSEAQQLAFNQWLDKGGIAIVGGGAQAAVTYPYFESVTGISAGSVAYAEDITPALLAYFGATGDALAEDVLICELSGAEDALIRASIAEPAATTTTNDATPPAANADNGAPLAAAYSWPLVALSRAGAGLVYSAAFDLAARPLTAWSNVTTLWQSMLLKSAPDKYSQAVSAVPNSYEYNYSNSYVLNGIPVENNANLFPITCLLIVYLLLVGIGAYFIFKRIDKRELLWLSIPATALTAALVIYAISFGAKLNTPLATSYTLVKLSDEDSRISSAAAVTSCGKSESIVSTAASLNLQPDSTNAGSYFYSDEEQQDFRIKTPNTQRYRYVLEGEAQPSALGFPGNAAWSVERMTLSSDEPFIGSIDSAAWLEADGIHATITNSTEYLLHDCMMLTSYGFVRLGELAPGQSVNTAIVTANATQQARIDSLPADSNYPLSLNGVLSSEVSVMPSSDQYRMYSSALMFAFYPECEANPEQLSALRHGVAQTEYAIRESRMSIVSQEASYDDSSSAFTFVGFNDDIGRIEFALNGAPIERTTHLGALASHVNFQAVGQTGIVFYAPGMIAPEKVTLDENNVPQFTGTLREGSSMLLNELQVVGFTLPNAQLIDIEDLNVILSFWDAIPDIDIYNWTTSAWERRQSIMLRFTGEEARPYVNEQGQFALRFSTAAASSYSEMQLPAFSVRGHLK